MTTRPAVRAASSVTGELAVPVLYLDLDGTVREGKDDALGRFVNGPDDVRVFPEAVEMMIAWKDRGGRIVSVSNQGGVALGIVSAEAVRAAMRETHLQTGSLFDKMCYCVHHPQAADPEMARCWCRKPSPGLIIEAAIDLARHYHELYPPHMGLMVGDREEDQKCAALAGLDFQWAHEWRAEAHGQGSALDEEVTP
jgi:D-glycero-D-manno-heptose 1,7-bisphosphate phosphatase